MKRFSILIVFFWASFCFCQSKNEKEERIDKSIFPKKAQTYFDGLQEKVSYLKFYKETDGDRSSYEAKFKINRLHYSVEFDTIGRLEDIEIVIKKRHISKSTFSNISDYFDTNFKKVRFIKIQKQYVNCTSNSDEHFIKHIIQDPYDKHTHFEIIAEVKTNEGRILKEFTFTNKGVFEKSRLVSSSSYEHALY